MIYNLRWAVVTIHGVGYDGACVEAVCNLEASLLNITKKIRKKTITIARLCRPERIETTHGYLQHQGDPGR